MGLVAQALGRNEAIAEPAGEGLLALHAASGVEEVGRDLLAHESREGHGEAEAVVEAEPGEVRAEARLGAGDAEARHERQPEPAADGRALDCGDDRGARGEQAHGLVVEVPPRVVFVRARAPAEVGARAEVTPLGGEHDGATAGVRVERLERLREARDQRPVEEVVGGTPDLGEGDAVVAETDAKISEGAEVTHAGILPVARRGFMLSVVSSNEAADVEATREPLRAIPRARLLRRDERRAGGAPLPGRLAGLPHRARTAAPQVRGAPPRWSCQLSFDADEFDQLIPWLETNRRGLSVLVHPLTGDALEEHSTLARWLGDPVPPAARGVRALTPARRTSPGRSGSDLRIRLGHWRRRAGSPRGSETPSSSGRSLRSAPASTTTSVELRARGGSPDVQIRPRHRSLRLHRPAADRRSPRAG